MNPGESAGRNDEDALPAENPWQTIGSRTVYENPWISVREDRVIRPDGHPGIYGVVHFRNTAVGVLPVDDNGDIWLVGQHRYPLHAYSWEIPEGGCPEGEDLLDCARRELREETGLVASSWEVVGRAHLSNSVSDEAAVIYRATGLVRGASDPEGCERLQVVRVGLDRAMAMLRNGEITDSMSVIALLWEAVRSAQGPR